jgi:hypothetical protein
VEQSTKKRQKKTNQPNDIKKITQILLRGEKGAAYGSGTGCFE